MRPLNCSHCGKPPTVEVSEAPRLPDIVILKCEKPNCCKAFAKDLRTVITEWNIMQAEIRSRYQVRLSKPVRGG